MILKEFLVRLKKESSAIEELNKRTYYTYLTPLFKMIAYDGDRLNKKHDLMITSYLKYISDIEHDDFSDGLSKAGVDEIIESLKAEIDCIIFKIAQKELPAAHL